MDGVVDNKEENCMNLYNIIMLKSERYLFIRRVL